jgi:hypothetical protein
LAKKLAMRSLTAILIILFCASTQVMAQKNVPSEKSTVNKEYDENGNLIQYDSTYVWQWNSDSSIGFPTNPDSIFGNHFPEFFGNFNSDSIFQRFGFSEKNMLMPFDHEHFFSHFQHSIPDSLFIDRYPFKMDSTMNLYFGHQFPGNLNFDEFDDLQNQLIEKFNRQNFSYPEFKTQEQKEEWEKLIQKQQKEKEELMKKWED